MDNVPKKLAFRSNAQKPIFTLAGESNATITTDSYAYADNRNTRAYQNRDLSSMTSTRFGHTGKQPLNRPYKQEHRVANSGYNLPGSSSPGVWSDTNINMQSSRDNKIMDTYNVLGYNLPGSSSSGVWSDTNINMQSSRDNKIMDTYDVLGYNRPGSSSPGVWSDTNINMQSSRDNKIMDTYDVLAMWSSPNYLSMLSREQLAVLRYIRPSLLNELLREVTRALADLRNRRALPNECGFCKNNGENEDYYSSHTLKDSYGRVVCPVLRSIQCPRCGATGDSAHTIKYCPEESSNDVGGLVPPRQESSTTSMIGVKVGASRHVPRRERGATHSSPNCRYPSFWSGFDMN